MQNFKESNLVLVVLSSILAVLLGISLFFNLNSGTEEILEEEYEVQLPITYDSLPSNIKEKYVLKSSTKKVLPDNKQELNQKISELKKQVNILKVTKKQTPEIKRLSSFASCYSMAIGSYSLPLECKKSITAFIDTNSDASYFELIGIVDRTEFKLFRDIEQNDQIFDELKTSEESLETLRMYSENGLATYRVMEANWLIKKHTDHKAKIFSANYKLTSDKGYRGVIVRAYK
ncbi:MAG: hypothetical protein GQ570_01310 [Helicobacteraceae bacterium]|nr:hypothetical protein [Helicobacteraceae bacterium]